MFTFDSVEKLETHDSWHPTTLKIWQLNTGCLVRNSNVSSEVILRTLRHSSIIKILGSKIIGIRMSNNGRSRRKKRSRGRELGQS